MILIFGRTGQLARTLQSSVDERSTFKALGRDDVDVTNRDAVTTAIHMLRPSVVINATAYTATDRAESEPEIAFAVNRDAPETMAIAARAVGARFVTYSTDFVFDGSASTPYSPTAQVAPLSVYGASKAAGEAATLAAFPDALVVRTAWLYGAGGQNFASTMLRLMAEREHLNVVADQIGTPTWTRSLSDATWDLLAQNAGGIHHLTDAGIASWYDFAVAIRDIALLSGRLEQAATIAPIAARDYPTVVPRPSYSVLDKGGTWPLLRQPPLHWREALTRCLVGEVATGYDQ